MTGEIYISQHLNNPLKRIDANHYYHKGHEDINTFNKKQRIRNKSYDELSKETELFLKSYDKVYKELQNTRDPIVVNQLMSEYHNKGIKLPKLKMQINLFRRNPLILKPNNIEELYLQKEEIDRSNKTLAYLSKMSYYLNKKKGNEEIELIAYSKAKDICEDFIPTNILNKQPKNINPLIITPEDNDAIIKDISCLKTTIDHENDFNILSKSNNNHNDTKRKITRQNSNKPSSSNDYNENKESISRLKTDEGISVNDFLSKTKSKYSSLNDCYESIKTLPINHNDSVAMSYITELGKSPYDKNTSMMHHSANISSVYGNILNMKKEVKKYDDKTIKKIYMGLPSMNEKPMHILKKIDKRLNNLDELFIHSVSNMK